MKIIKLFFFGMLCTIVSLFSGCGHSGGNNETYTISGTITSETATGPGMEGVTVGLSGSATMTATTDANGRYQFSAVSKGTYKITPTLPGFDILPWTIGTDVDNASVPGMDFIVKAVLLGGPVNSSRYTDNGDGTITDNTTGLIWQKKGFERGISWEDANDYCTSNYVELPGTGWRLPSKDELLGIVDLNYLAEYYTTPTIDPVFTFTSTYWYWKYWTSTAYVHPVAGDCCAWVVRFDDGGLDWIMKTYPYLSVRCVR